VVSKTEPVSRQLSVEETNGSSVVAGTGRDVEWRSSQVSGRDGYLTGRRWMIVRRLDGRLALVPEGQHDSSQARSAWNHEEIALSLRDD
jgi:hypothetical protein